MPLYRNKYFDSVAFVSFRGGINYSRYGKCLNALCLSAHTINNNASFPLKENISHCQMHIFCEYLWASFLYEYIFFHQQSPFAD